MTEVNLSPHHLAAQTIETGNALTAAKTDVATHKVNVKQARDALRAREVELTLQGVDGKNAEMRKAQLDTLTEAERDTLTEAEAALAHAELELSNLHTQWQLCLELNALARLVY